MKHYPKAKKQIRDQVCDYPNKAKEIPETNLLLAP